MRLFQNRLLAGISAMLLVMLCCLPLCANAAEHLGTLALWCVKDEEVISGMHWRIYRVGHREENDYVFEGDFAEYRPTLGDQSQPMLQWHADTVAAAAETLRVYAITDQIPVRSEGLTNGNGNLSFSGLDDGLYLVIGDTLKVGTTTYIPSAIFFEMNGQEEAYLNAFPKIILETLDEQTADYSVRKIWANRDAQPPALDTYILCELYRDGELQNTVRLDASNDWIYEWSDKSGHEWLVKEKEIPDNYTVVYSGNHTKYVIVNTYENPHSDSSVTDINTTTAETTTTDDRMTDWQTTSSTLSTTASSAPDSTVLQTTVSQTITTTVPTASGETPGLPQTGQLWWPVPVLGGSGMLLLLIGFRLRRKDDDA